MTQDDAGALLVLRHGYAIAHNELAQRKRMPVRHRHATAVHRGSEDALRHCVRTAVRFRLERVVHEDVYCSRYESIIARVLHRRLKLGASESVSRAGLLPRRAAPRWTPGAAHYALSLGTPDAPSTWFSGTKVLHGPAVVEEAPDPPDDPGTSSSGSGGTYCTVAL